MLNRYTEADKFLNLLQADKELAYDVETNGIKWQKTFVCGYSLSDGHDKFYVPVRHLGGGIENGNIGNVEEFEKEIAKTVKKRTKKLIGHNIKFDAHQSLNHGIDLGKNVGDTMVYAAAISCISIKGVLLYPSKRIGSPE